MVGGVPFRYVDRGQGNPVVFVHGIVTDHRVWNTHLQVISARARCIAYDQRYFGVNDWPKAGPQYSVATHADDLAGLVEQVVQGPAHIVGWSYGGAVALAMAAAKPERVKSLCLYEPGGLFSVVANPEQRAAIANERRGMAAVAEATAKGELESAVKQAAEWTEGRPGSFSSLPREVQQVVLENAHTLERHFLALPSTVSCADLRAVSVPVTIVRGANTRSFFAIFAHAIGECLANVENIVLPGVGHFAPAQYPDLFARVVLGHLERCGAVAT